MKVSPIREWTPKWGNRNLQANSRFSLLSTPLLFLFFFKPAKPFPSPSRLSFFSFYQSTCRDQGFPFPLFPFALEAKLKQPTDSPSLLYSFPAEERPTPLTFLLMAFIASLLQSLMNNRARPTWKRERVVMMGSQRWGVGSFLLGWQHRWLEAAGKDMEAWNPDVGAAWRWQEAVTPRVSAC